MSDGRCAVRVPLLCFISAALFASRVPKHIIPDERIAGPVSQHAAFPSDRIAFLLSGCHVAIPRMM